MANIPDEANGHALPIQWQNELVAFVSDEHVVVAIRGRHPNQVFPDNYPVGVLDAAQSRALGLRLQQLAQELEQSGVS